MRGSYDKITLTLGALALCACRGEVALGGLAGEGGAQSGTASGSSSGSGSAGAPGSTDSSGSSFASGSSGSSFPSDSADASFPSGSSGSAFPSDSSDSFTGLAGFQFVINDQVEQPMDCPSDDWEFPPTPLPDAGAHSVLLINTGSAPMAYIAASLWNGTGYVPGVATGEPNQLVGVLDPGGKVDITSVYAGGVIALVGSAVPFASPDAGKFVGDQATIPWPAGVAGSGGAAQMWTAEIEARDSCGLAYRVW